MLAQKMYITLTLICSVNMAWPRVKVKNIYLVKLTLTIRVYMTLNGLAHVDNRSIKVTLYKFKSLFIQD